MINLDQAAEANRYNRAYSQGKGAAIDGEPSNANPFQVNSQEAIAWLDGWIDGNNYKSAVTA